MATEIFNVGGFEAIPNAIIGGLKTAIPLRRLLTIRDIAFRRRGGIYPTVTPL